MVGDGHFSKEKCPTAVSEGTTLRRLRHGWIFPYAKEKTTNIGTDATGVAPCGMSRRAKRMK